MEGGCENLMESNEWFALALEPSLIMRELNMQADPWQREVLFCHDKNILLCCSRGAGKSRVTSAIALHSALFKPKTKVLLVSRSHRQSLELFRYVKEAYRALNNPVELVKNTQHEYEFENGSRIIAVPGQEETIRGIQGVHLLILDEAARIPDKLYASVRAMVATVAGRTLALSTPWGQRGWFYREWIRETSHWRKFEITWKDCPRITSEFIQEERMQFGDSWVKQEYECSFTSLEGLVYPDFYQCKSEFGEKTGRLVGGIDWGFRNPFCALGGTLDRHDDVLWIDYEYYTNNTPLHVISEKLPKGYHWYADPSGKTEIMELRANDHTVQGAANQVRLGIQAVTARINTGRLKIHPKCVHVLQEAQLYRYPNDTERAVWGRENPVDESNHALDALRYLVMGIDRKKVAQWRAGKTIQIQTAEDIQAEEKNANSYNIWEDESAWTNF